MKVTDEQVASLRSYLTDDPEVWMAKHRRLLQSGDIAGYEALAHAAFVTAAHRRFSPAWTRAEVISFVADMRVKLAEQSRMVNPTVAENLIRRALEDPSLDAQVFHDSTQESLARAHFALLAALIEDAGLSDAAFDEFVNAIRDAVAQS